jgi:hypothetical protein
MCRPMCWSGKSIVFLMESAPTLHGSSKSNKKPSDGRGIIWIKHLSWKNYHDSFHPFVYMYKLTCFLAIQCWFIPRILSKSVVGCLIWPWCRTAEESRTSPCPLDNFWAVYSESKLKENNKCSVYLNCYFHWSRSNETTHYWFG